MSLKTIEIEPNIDYEKLEQNIKDKFKKDPHFANFEGSLLPEDYRAYDEFCRGELTEEEAKRIEALIPDGHPRKDFYAMIINKIISKAFGERLEHKK